MLPDDEQWLRFFSTKWSVTEKRWSEHQYQIGGDGRSIRAFLGAISVRSVTGNR